MDEPHDRVAGDTRQLDLVVTGVDDFEVIATIEATVREAFAQSAVDGRWTVAVRPRHAFEGWTVGVLGCREGTRMHRHLKVASADSLRETLTALFGTRAAVLR